MMESKMRGVDFIAVQHRCAGPPSIIAKKKIHIGKNLTRGLGAGMNPEIGKRAAEETKEEIQQTLKGSDMVFVACGMGGGTGTGAAPIVAKTAKELGALTVGVVTKPFSFEGAQRMRLAEQGLEELRKEVDALIVVPNDRLLATVSKETTLKAAFAMCDDIFKQAVEGISDLITQPGIINVDFADIRAVMENAGSRSWASVSPRREPRAGRSTRSSLLPAPRDLDQRRKGCPLCYRRRRGPRHGRGPRGSKDHHRVSRPKRQDHLRRYQGRQTQEERDPRYRYRDRLPC
jgi:cell division protein FtsZ